jgi:hypothetical protein
VDLATTPAVATQVLATTTNAVNTFAPVVVATSTSATTKAPASTTFAASTFAPVDFATTAAARPTAEPAAVKPVVVEPVATEGSLGTEKTTSDTGALSKSAPGAEEQDDMTDGVVPATTAGNLANAGGNPANAGAGEESKGADYSMQEGEERTTSTDKSSGQVGNSVSENTNNKSSSNGGLFSIVGSVVGILLCASLGYVYHRRKQAHSRMQLALADHIEDFEGGAPSAFQPEWDPSDVSDPGFTDPALESGLDSEDPLTELSEMESDVENGRANKFYSD